MNLNIADTRTKNKIEKKYKEMTIRELREEIGRLKKENITPAPLIVEINEKLTLALSCLIFILMGAPLAIITRRREKSINIGIAILIIIIYYPLFIACEALGIQGNLNPALAMWIPNIIFGSIGTVLTFRLCVS
jgi:lipopolysaccharide export LptBFGC system permease protein LptF